MNQDLVLSFGAHDSTEDIRTITADQVTATASPYSLPANAEVDFSQFPVSVRFDQFQVGECTSEATTKVAEYKKKTPMPYNPDWGYLMTKVFYDRNLTEGSSALANLQRMKGTGIPTKDIRDKYPLDIEHGYAAFINDFRTRYNGVIPKEILDDAAQNKIAGYYSVPLDGASLANQIASGNPLIFRIAVGDNTYADIHGNVTMSASKLLPFRVPNPVTGGHLISASKYNNFNGQDMLLGGPNSWGLRWCPETAGYWSFILSTYKPYFTEAWGILEDPIETVFKHKFTKSILYGQTSPEVVALQRVLVIMGFLVMPQGVKYGYYGDLTAAAVLKYQLENQIDNNSALLALKGHNIGPKTRGSLNDEQGV